MQLSMSSSSCLCALTGWRALVRLTTSSSSYASHGQHGATQYYGDGFRANQPIHLSVVVVVGCRSPLLLMQLERERESAGCLLVVDPADLQNCASMCSHYVRAGLRLCVPARATPLRTQTSTQRERPLLASSSSLERLLHSVWRRRWLQPTHHRAGAGFSHAAAVTHITSQLNSSWNGVVCLQIRRSTIVARTFVGFYFSGDGFFFSSNSFTKRSASMMCWLMGVARDFPFYVFDASQIV